MIKQSTNGAGRVQEGTQQWLGMLESLAEQIQKQQQNSQQMVQELMNTFIQLFTIRPSYAQEGFKIAQRTTAEVPIDDYDEKSVGEITEQLDNLSAEELRRVRDYEKRNKNRDTLLEQIDRKAVAAS